jgi:hypothetical protein
MKPLELGDQRHLDAAQGWFELGNCIEATEEMEQIAPETRYDQTRPAVGCVGWTGCAADGDAENLSSFS